MKKNITKSCASLAVTAALAIMTCSTAQAGPIGNSGFSTHIDNNGNMYTNNRIGNTTFTNGYGSNGSSWNQTSNRIGNTSYTNGTSSNGSSYNGTSSSIGSNTFHNGTDSNGNNYNYACNRFGCN